MRLVRVTQLYAGAWFGGGVACANANCGGVLPWTRAPETLPFLGAKPAGAGLHAGGSKLTDRKRGFLKTLCREINYILTNFVSNLLTIC